MYIMPVKNTLVDLNNILFEQLERLNDDDCDLDKEIPRSKAIVDVGKAIIDNAQLALDSSKYISECKGVEAIGGVKRQIPEMLEMKKPS